MDSEEITDSNRQEKQVMKLKDLTASFQQFNELPEVTLVDWNGRPYACQLLKDSSESESDALNDAIGCESVSVDLNEIKEIFKILTDDQRKIVMHIYYMYKNIELYEDKPKIILQGPAGTGKTTVINLIEKLITWEENKTSGSLQKMKVLKCAFTGKAAADIGGVTLNHIFSIPVYKTRNLHEKRLSDTKKELLENCIFFICDEISMVGERLMSSVNLRLQQIFQNDKLYGGRFVLLVGDLYQIDRIIQKPVYPKSELWTCCEFYEFTKIIRQKDEAFVNALNNFRDSKMTEEDINLLRSREIQDIDQVPDSVIHLFYENSRVDEYNIAKLDKSNEREEIVSIIDFGNLVRCDLRVKIGIRYMITTNIDVSDGLANGTTGIVKDFDYDEDGSVIVIWMEFNSNVIGRKTKLDYMEKYSKPGFDNWVPIQRTHIKGRLNDDPNNSQIVIGNMFPLRAAEALPVYKSQGQTYHDGVCIHITNDTYDKLRTDKTLQYVALTRVKRLEDLYIIGNLNFSDTNTKKFMRTENELNRLRMERKLKLAYETFEDKTGDVIIFLNTSSTFNDHYQFVTTDKWYGNGSLLIFTDTNTIESDNIEIPDFEIAFRSDNGTALRSDGKIICYKKANKSLELITSISDDENKIYVTLFLYEKLLYIIAGVNTGNLNDKEDFDAFKLRLNQLIIKYIPNNKSYIYFLGNCPKKMYDLPITNGRSQCDIVFTHNFNIQRNLGSYEYIPSSHKPIYVKFATNVEPEVTTDHDGKPTAIKLASTSFSQQFYMEID